MEARTTRKGRTSKHKAQAKKRSSVGASSQLTADDPEMSGSTAGVCSVLRRLVTWLKQSVLFSWLHYAAVALKQSIMGNQSWPMVLVQIGLWLLLLWLLSNLHMGVPCFLLALVFWLHKTYGGPPLSTFISFLRQE